MINWSLQNLLNRSLTTQIYTKIFKIERQNIQFYKYWIKKINVYLYKKTRICIYLRKGPARSPDTNKYKDPRLNVISPAFIPVSLKSGGFFLKNKYKSFAIEFSLHLSTTQHKDKITSLKLKRVERKLKFLIRNNRKAEFCEFLTRKRILFKIS